MGSKAAVVLILTIAASALGFARELATAYVYATSVAADAVALMLIYIEGVSAFMTYGVASQVLVPMFVRMHELPENPERDVISGMFTWIVILGVPLAVLAFLAPDVLTTTIAPLASEEYRRALQPLTVTLVPTFMLLAGAGVASGALRAREDFYTPVVGRALFSLIAAVWIFVAGAALGTWAAAWGLLVGAVAQLAVQSWRLHANGWRMSRPRLLHMSLGAIVRATWPVLAALFITQLAMLAGQRALASDLPTGIFATTNYAQRLLSIVSLLTLSVSTVAATDLARKFADGGLDALTARMSGHLQALSFILAPATVVLMASSRILVSAAFGRGEFSASAAEETAGILWVFSLALMPAGVCTLLQLIFTSAGRTPVVLLVSVPFAATVWGLTVVLKGSVGATLLAASYVGGVGVFFLTSLLATAWLVGAAPVRAMCRYLLLLTLRVLLAAAGPSLILWQWPSVRNASGWIAGSEGVMVTVLSTSLFLSIFIAMSVYTRDAGWRALASNGREMFGTLRTTVYRTLGQS